MRRFEKITISNCLQLLKTLIEVGTLTESVVRQVYSTYAVNYDETAEFLSELGLIRRSGSDCWLPLTLPHEGNPSDDASARRRAFVDQIRIHLIEGDSEYSQIAMAFLNRFDVRNERYIYSPKIADKLQSSAVRNLLIELEVLDHDDSTDEYVIINPDTITALLSQCVVPVGSAEFESLLKRQQEIGRLAEHEVLKFEKTRLSECPELASLVEHVALSDVSAGYDIRSYEEHVGAFGERVPRYIEVKAVPGRSYRFYWSRNEVEVAERLGDKYFLYLVPIKAANSVDIEALRIVKNPRTLLIQSDWLVSIETYRLECTNVSQFEKA